jgi:hypothetical protein
MLLLTTGSTECSFTVPQMNITTYIDITKNGHHKEGSDIRIFHDWIKKCVFFLRREKKWKREKKMNDRSKWNREALNFLEK